MTLSYLTWSGWLWLAFCIVGSLEHVNMTAHNYSPTTGTFTSHGAKAVARSSSVRILALAAMWTWFLWLVTP